MTIPTTRPGPKQLAAPGNKTSPAHSNGLRRQARRRQPGRLSVQAREGLLGRLAGQLWAPQVAEPTAPVTLTSEEVEVVFEQSPAPTDVFAPPLPGDDEDVALLRQLLAETQLEKEPLLLAYDAERDGWSVEGFHERVDNTGAALVVALTVGGAVVGGYNPAGWAGQGEDKDLNSAFLFVWPDGDLSQRPVKLPKVGGPGEAVIRDARDQGIYFGRDALIIPLTPGNERFMKSKLGAFYSRRPDGGRHLMSEGSPVKGGSRGTQLVSLRAYVANGTANNGN